MLRALGLMQHGARLEALELVRGPAETLERKGHIQGACWAQAMVGRLLLALGRRTEGLRTLDAVAKRAASQGLVCTAELAKLARSEGPLGQAGEADAAEPSLASHPADAIRARLLAAVRAGARGDMSHARTLLGTLEIPSGPDYALDRALGELVHVVDL